MSTGMLWIDWVIAILFLALWFGAQPLADWYGEYLDKKRAQVIECQLDEDTLVTFTGNWSKRQMRKKIKEIENETAKIKAEYGS
jgi:hypothetical protein